MIRTKRTLYLQALDILLKGKMASVLISKDFELLKEIAKLAQKDAPLSLSATDPSLFLAWRNAVTKFHLKGWTYMTPENIEYVLSKYEKKFENNLKI